MIAMKPKKGSSMLLKIGRAAEREAAKKKAEAKKRKPVASYFTEEEVETLDRTWSKLQLLFINSRTTLVLSLLGTYLRDRAPTEPETLPHELPPKGKRQTVVTALPLALIEELDAIGQRFGVGRALVIRNLCLLRLSDPRWEAGCEETLRRLWPSRPRLHTPMFKGPATPRTLTQFQLEVEPEKITTRT